MKKTLVAIAVASMLITPAFAQQWNNGHQSNGNGNYSQRGNPGNGNHGNQGNKNNYHHEYHGSQWHGSHYSPPSYNYNGCYNCGWGWFGFALGALLAAPVVVNVPSYPAVVYSPPAVVLDPSTGVYYSPAPATWQSIPVYP